MSNRAQESGVLSAVSHMALIETNRLSKRYGSHVVVRDVTFACYPGEIVLILGANGAGKSTLLRIVAGLARADVGRLQRQEGVRVGFAGHYTCLYPRLSVKANLSLYASLAGIRATRLDELMERWKLVDVQHKVVADVSRGTQSKTSLVRALIPDPTLLVLDEPSSNLDDTTTALLRQVLLDRATRGGAALVATHDIDRLGDIATRVVVMERGTIAADSGVGANQVIRNSVIEQYRRSNR